MKFELCSLAFKRNALTTGPFENIYTITKNYIRKILLLSTKTFVIFELFTKPVHKLGIAIKIKFC